jgi:hypothetical protein
VPSETFGVQGFCLQGFIQKSKEKGVKNVNHNADFLWLSSI